jgi:hypothetical protein
MLLAVDPKSNPLRHAWGRVYQRWRQSAAPPAAAPPPVPADAPLAPAPAILPMVPLQRPNLHHLAQPGADLPEFVRDSRPALRYLALLGPLDWDHFPERPANRPWPGKPPAPRAPYVAAFLIKIAENHRSMGQLREFLIDNPALVWLLGFPLVPDPQAKLGFDVARSVPLRRQFGRILRDLDNAALQFLLDCVVTAIRQALPPELQATFGDVVSIDTKHIIAWVKENNPKAYVDDRFDKTKQPKGDPDCKLGCKRRHNRGDGNGADHAAAPEAAGATLATPTTNPVPASQNVSVGEFYWGYASGVVTTKVPGWGEFVLAELTQTFDQGDPSYFWPLLAQTERRLGRKPRFGALDKAFDAFYVYQYFHDAGGFAAVPLVAKGTTEIRTFSPEGLPLCAAGLAMPLKFAYTDRTKTLVVHERGRYVCPLRQPPPGATVCPIPHEKWATGGCTTDMPTCAGARIRYQLDRQSDQYKAVFKQRTADERSNSQAVDLGIERPRLRRGSAIVNQDTLIYILMGLRAVQRIQARKAELAQQAATLPQEVPATPNT